MKVKNSYLKLMLWTLSGAAIGAGLGAGSILFAKGGGCIPGRTAVCGSSAVCLMDSADSLAGTGRLLPGFDEQGKKVVSPYGFR